MEIDADVDTNIPLRISIVETMLWYRYKQTIIPDQYTWGGWRRMFEDKTTEELETELETLKLLRM